MGTVEGRKPPGKMGAGPAARRVGPRTSPGPPHTQKSPSRGARTLSGRKLWDSVRSTASSLAWVRAPWSPMTPLCHPTQPPGSHRLPAPRVLAGSPFPPGTCLCSGFTEFSAAQLQASGPLHSCAPLPQLPPQNWSPPAQLDSGTEWGREASAASDPGPTWVVGWRGTWLSLLHLVF